MKLQETQAFQQLDYIQQKVAIQNRSTISHSAILLKNVGTERWEKLSQHLPTKWKNIVKELAAV